MVVKKSVEIFFLLKALLSESFLPLDQLYLQPEKSASSGHSVLNSLAIIKWNNFDFLFNIPVLQIRGKTDN